MCGVGVERAGIESVWCGSRERGNSGVGSRERGNRECVVWE